MLMKFKIDSQNIDQSLSDNDIHVVQAKASKRKLLTKLLMLNKIKGLNSHLS